MTMHSIMMEDVSLVPSKVVCVGKNFPDHVREMGDDCAPLEPVIFLKPNSAIVVQPQEITIPQGLGLLHHEVELCAVIGEGGRDFTQDQAVAALAGFAVGIDLTLRDRQTAAKKAQGPWALAKGFDASAVFGGFVPAEKVGPPHDWPLSLQVNGKVRQQGSTREMLFSPETVVAFVSRFMTFERGDVIMFGTPSGIGAIQDGDRIQACVGMLPKLDFVVHRPKS